MHSPALKVCGLTRPKDVAICQGLGVAFTGFIFAPESPRYIPPEGVLAMPRGSAKRVGVFTRTTVAETNAAARKARLDFVQLHGGQDEAFCRAVGSERVIKVFWPERYTVAALGEELRRFAPVVSYFLFDAGKSGGGSGRVFGWEVLRKIEIPRPWFLAGGIGPVTAADAVTACLPDVLDVNSGVEAAPGVKDAAKLRELTTILRGETGRE